MNPVVFVLTMVFWAAPWVFRALPPIMCVFLYSSIIAHLDRRAHLVRIHDPVLNSVTPRDVSRFIHGLLYSSAVVTALFGPPGAFWYHLASFAARAFTMWILPLKAPDRAIPLNDPVVMALVGDEPMNDLFVSGHTLFVTINFLLFPHPVNAVAALLMPGLLLVQHCHYTVDIVAAQLVAWAIAGRA